LWLPISVISEYSVAKNMNNFDLNNLSKHLFWDVDINTLNADINKSFIIQRVLEYGLYEDWKKIYDYYGIQIIVNAVINFRSLDERSLSFISLLSQTPKENFLCYTLKQSIPKHWNF